MQTPASLSVRDGLRFFSPLSLLYVALLGFFIYTRANPGNDHFSFYKPLEDDDFYLSFFHRSWPGRMLMRAFWPIAGIHYANVLLVFFFAAATAVAASLFAAVFAPRSGRAGAWLVAALAWAFLNRHLYTLATIPSAPGLRLLASRADFVNGLTSNTGNFMVRFYEPFLGFALFLLALLFRRRFREDGNFWWIAPAALAGLALGKSPWVASTLALFLALSAAENGGRWRARLFDVAAAASVLTGLLASVLGPRSADLPSRLDTQTLAQLDFECVWPSLAWLAVGIALGRSEEGRFLRKLCLANLGATFLPFFLLGYAVSPDHFLRILSLAPAVVLGWGLSRVPAMKNAWVARALGLVLVWFAAKQSPGVAYPEYYVVPRALAAPITAAGEACAHGKARYVLAKDPAY